MTQYLVDLSGIESRDDLHDVISRAFLFPDYYGRNWDAFDEGIVVLAPPVFILVTGFESLRFVLPREAELFVECLNLAAKKAAWCEYKQAMKNGNSLP
jgi:RNAse (barnase) inhibitor barstar